MTKTSTETSSETPRFLRLKDRAFEATLLLALLLHLATSPNTRNERAGRTGGHDHRRRGTGRVDDDPRTDIGDTVEGGSSRANLWDRHGRSVLMRGADQVNDGGQLLFVEIKSGRFAVHSGCLLLLHAPSSAWSSSAPKSVLVSDTFGASAKRKGGGRHDQAKGCCQDEGEGYLGHLFYECVVFLARSFEEVWQATENS